MDGAAEEEQLDYGDAEEGDFEGNYNDDEQLQYDDEEEEQQQALQEDEYADEEQQQQNEVAADDADAAAEEGDQQQDDEGQEHEGMDTLGARAQQAGRGAHAAAIDTLRVGWDRNRRSFDCR
jgi:hypothetical protein